nr:MAG TPA: 50S ribosomal protein L2 [Caudoviricetes sp.]
MERLTVPDVRVDEHTTRRSIIDGNAVREHAMEIYWRLKDYEDTGLTPVDIKELLDVAVSKTDKVLRLKEELHTMKNELCQYCGKYKQAHEGACDGCKWREK